MFDTPITSLTPDGALSHASGLRALADRCEVGVIETAAHWADLHGVLDRAESPSLSGMEQLVPFGGEGTPQVAEFAPAELGAELAMSPYAATMLIADALDLRHRLPLLWARVRAGEVKPWVGRRTAAASRGLSLEAVAHVDQRVSPWAASLNWGRLERIVDAAVIEADPERAQSKADSARSDHGVWVNPDAEHGSMSAFIRGDAADVLQFDAGLDSVADNLALLGDESSKDQRRAHAVGILGDPQQALDLLCGSLRAESAISSKGSAAHRPAATLYIHVSREAFMSGANGVARVEGVGPVTIDQVRRWLGHRHVDVKPVLDIAGLAPVDSYEIPDRYREAVHLISPADIFPFASSTRRTGDLDHTLRYVPPDEGGPPGQTRIGNLGRMTRRHHRIKTHGRWQVKQPYPGIFIWRSPHGRYWLVDHTGTRRLPPKAA
jgi:hypothetical protein